jgi:phasin family protein
MPVEVKQSKPKAAAANAQVASPPISAAAPAAAVSADVVAPAPIQAETVALAPAPVSTVASSKPDAKPSAAPVAAPVAAPIAAPAAAIVKKIVVAKKAPAKSPVKAPVKAPKKAVAPRTVSTSKKDTPTMTKTTAMTDTVQAAMKDAAAKAKTTFEKGQAAMGGMGTFTKGNVEAVVESSKLLASGLQELSKTYMADSKAAVETMTSEMKDLASVKSPAEFFEKQSAMVRKQFDAAVAASSKNSEAMLKLASEAFQPISSRVSIAVDKIKSAA